MTRPAIELFVCGFLLSCLLAGCGSGSSSIAPIVRPTFTSIPLTTADEATPYTYQLVATSPDNGAVTFSLTQMPDGASLTGSTIDWTPTHAQSRIANQFSVTATNSSGGSATQSWSVTPTGVVVISAVLTYWTPTGTIDRPRVFLADLPYPAALLPQPDGSITRLQGITNPDGTFSIPHVPAGYYWLQLSPNQNFWTSTSGFDAGQDIVGSPSTTTSQNTTTFDISLTNADPSQLGDIFTMSTNTRLPVFSLLPGFITGSTTVNATLPLSSTLDLSQVNTIFFNQYEPVNSGGFSGLALGPSLTLSNVTITTGAVNSVGGALSASPQASIPLNIKGSAWLNNFQNTAPSTPTQSLTDFSVSVQPFVQNRVAASLSGTIVGPNLALLVATPPTRLGVSLSPYFCRESSGPNVLPSGIFSLPPIVSDQDFGSIPYGDPYPEGWLREFQYCQHATVDLPRPNSTITDSFLLTSGEVIALPTAPVAPLVGPIQSPTLNGASIFQSASLNTTTLNLMWTPPSGSTPSGYYVSVLQLGTFPDGSTHYVAAGGFATAKNSMTVPFIAAGNIYVFFITATVNARANVETSPFRSQIPIAHSTVLSAPITINPGATANH